MGGCKAPITTFIVEPFVPHDQEYYLSIVSERLGSTISFSECGGIEIEENWDKVKTVFLPTEKPMTQDACAPLIATLPLEVFHLYHDLSPYLVWLISYLHFINHNYCTLCSEIGN
jgi:succinyl-CoA synthetase beta subunit